MNRDEHFVGSVAYISGYEAGKKEAEGEIARLKEELRVCSVCQKQTDWACADCRIDLRRTVYLCEKPECRMAHDEKCPHELQQRIIDLKNDLKREQNILGQRTSELAEAVLKREEAETKLLSQAAHIDHLRKALEPFAIVLNSPDSNRRRRPDEDVAIGVKASDVYEAFRVLSTPADTFVEEVRRLREALDFYADIRNYKDGAPGEEVYARELDAEGNPVGEWEYDEGNVAREALAAHQKRGSR